MNKPVIYIAGKLSDQPEGYIKNMHKMIREAEEIRRLGFAVVVPCLDVLCGLVMGDMTYEDYFENNLAIMRKCDGVYMMQGWTASKGAVREYKIAEDAGIPVFLSAESLQHHFGGVCNDQRRD